jgi:hypothetical protein
MMNLMSGSDMTFSRIIVTFRINGDDYINISKKVLPVLPIGQFIDYISN